MSLAAASGVFLLVTALAEAAPSAAEPGLQIIVANSDGTHAAAQLPLTGAQLAGAKAIWAWTAQLPPRRFEIRKTPPRPEELLAELRRSPARPLEVRVRGWSRPEELATLRVLAAPVAMWMSVPEPLLPAYPLSKEGVAAIPVREPVRLRVVGDGAGTVWEDVDRNARSIDVALRRPAEDAKPTFLSNDGKPVGRVYALVMSRHRGDATPEAQAQFAGDEKGLVRIRALPGSEIVTLFVTTERTAPHMLSGTAADLSRSIRLPPAAELRGRFVDENDRPLKGVKVEAEGWVSPDAPAASRNDALSDESGKWLLRTLPRTRIIVRGSAPDRATFRRQVSLEEGDIDLGTIALSPSPRVVLAVSDPEQRRLANVLVTTGHGFEGRTSPNGSVTLTGLPADDATTITLAAKGFATRTIQLAPPLPKNEHVIMERTFSIAGRVVTDSGTPADNAMAVVTMDASHWTERVDADGAFSFDIRPDEDFELTFESPSAASLTRMESAGRAGEARDLGTIRLSSGLLVRGRVTDSASAPVAGARVWTVRPSAGGVVTAWAEGRIVQAVSDENGAFEMRGPPAGPALLRIDGSDFARAYRDVVVEAEPVDLGTIELVRGQTVTINAGRADAVVARIDLRGRLLDADMLTAPVIEREARVRHVPPGKYDVTVINARSVVVCERHVQVTEGSDASLQCPPPMNVRGRVVIDGAPAYGGTLMWTQPTQTDALIQSRPSPMGALQQRLYGVGNGVVVVLVRADGTFETDQLRAGQWQVGWRSDDSVGTSDRPFAIPDAANAQIVVEFTGGMIHGRVVDARDQPVAGARVREIQGPLHAMAAGDGSFTITAVPPGVHRLHATLGAQGSTVVEVRVEAAKPVPEVLLKINDAEEHVISVRVLDVDGQPKPNAFVFIELRGGIKTVTTDASGVATAAIDEGLPAVARLVAFADNAWAFGDHRPASDAEGPQTAVVRFERTGALRIRSKTAEGAPVLLSPHVPGDLAWMLGRIGSFLSVAPQEPLVISGLPAGTYEILVGSSRAFAQVTAGSTSTADLP